MSRSTAWSVRGPRHLGLLVGLGALAGSWSQASPAYADPPTTAGSTTPAPKREIKPPRLVTFVEATLPPETAIPEGGVAVLLRVAIDPTGRVTSAKVEGPPHPGLDEAASAAVSRFIFEPAEVDGRKTAVTILYRYQFVVRVEKKAALAELAGLVRAQEDRRGLGGVRITLERTDAPSPQDDQARPTGETTTPTPQPATATAPAPKLETTTDEAGRFRLGELPAGHYRVHIERADGTGIDTEETLATGQRLEVLYALAGAKPAGANGGAEAGKGEDDEDEVTVVARPLTRAVTSTEIRADESRKVPGAQGDVVRVVESMPGVARVSAGSSSIVVWGAGPQDTRVYVDSVPLPAVYHLGGSRTVIAPDFVQSVELVPGGQGATWGRAIGGLVHVKTRPLSTESTRGAISIDAIDTSAFLEAKIAKDLRVAIAGRRGHLADVVPLFTDRDVGILVPMPKFFDVHGRVGWNPRPNESLELNVLAFRDNLNRSVASADPDFVRSDGRQIGAGRAWLRYQRSSREGGTLTITPFVGLDDARTEDRFGPVTSVLDRHSELYGARAAWNSQVTDWLTVSAGLDAQVDAVRVTRSGSIGLPAREGDRHVFGQPPAEQVNADLFKVATVAAATYVELDASLLSERLHIVPGMRLEPYVVSVNQRTPAEGNIPSTGAFVESFDAEPRLAVRYAPNRQLAFHGAIGRYRQPPLPEDLSAVYSNPLLPAPSATHIVLGAAAHWTKTLGLEVTGFATESTGLAVRNTLASPPVGEALVANGRGRSFGAQFLLRQQLWHGLTGWIAWTMLRSERKDGPNAPTRLSDYDQTHVVSLVLAQSLGRGFDVGLRFRYATGYPRTPVVGSLNDLLRGTSQPRFGTTNSTRLPDFAQLDVRASKHLKLGPGELDLWLEVLNVTNHENVEEYVYDAKFQRRGGLTGLPILPSIGARLSW